jgi:IS605 OrfB family transposase
MLKSDLELELESGCSLETLRAQATKILTKKKAELERNQKEKPDQAPKDNSKALFNSLFQAYDKAKAPQQRCAIAYLLKNNCQVSEVEEDPEAYQQRRRKKEIEIKRLEEQLKSRLPKGRNLSEQDWLEALEQAQGLILDEDQWREVQASLTRKQSPVPFSISYETNTDLRWSRNEHKRICVSFNGEGISQHTFEIFCDQRQLHWFERIAQDYKIFTQNKDQVPGGLLTLRSARLVWQEGEGEGEPWQVHRLLLHCSVETRLWTAEGTEEVRAEKIAEKQKIIDSMKYEYLKRRQEKQRLNSHQRHNAQKNGAPCNFGESKQGEYVDRLLAKAIVEVASQYRASSIVLPDVRNIREATEGEVRARAEQRFPGYQELQDCYAKDYRASIHTWSYDRLAKCIQFKAERAGIATEKVQQPHGDSPQEKARDLVLAAYANRKVSVS